MQFGWIVSGPGSTWIGDGVISRNFRDAKVFHDPAYAKSQARRAFPTGNLTLYYLEAEPVESTTYTGDWQDFEKE